MNMVRYTSSWQSAAGAAEECQYMKQLQEDLKTIFLNWTKCKVRFICVGLYSNIPLSLSQFASYCGNYNLKFSKKIQNFPKFSTFSKIVQNFQSFPKCRGKLHKT